LPVPELTRSADIQLNEQLSLRDRVDALASSNRKLPDVRFLRGNAVRRSYSAWRRCFSFEQVMMISKTAKVPQASSAHPVFNIVCINCDSLGIVFDCPEGAPPSTQIKCRHCGVPRGTLGDLRALSCSDRRDMFEI
jgi:ribosomal protein S27E